MSQKYHVYLYLDPRTTPPEPIYVGKGQRKRWRSHLSWTHNPWLRRKVRRIREAGFEPLIEILHEDLTAEEAIDHERRLIAEYGRADRGTGSLCNFTDGGEGALGWVPSAETRALWSKQRSSAQTPAQYKANCGRRQGAETRRKISEATKGHPVSEKQRETIRQYNRTRPITDDMRQKWSKTRKATGISEDHQRRMQEGKAHAQASRTAEERAAIVEKAACKKRGQKRSEETKRKMREAWVRRKAKLL